MLAYKNKQIDSLLISELLFLVNNSPMLHIFNKLQKRQFIESMFSYKGIPSYSNPIRQNHLT